MDENELDDRELSPGEVLERREVFDGKVLHLVVDLVRFPNGSTGHIEKIRHPGAAAMVPVTRDGQVVLIRQYRHATGRWLLEIPAGKLDSGEEPEVCARRELVEEIGYRAGRLTPLGWIWTTPGFTDEKIWLYLAQDLETAEQSLEDDEILHVERIPFEQAVEMALSGELRDSKSVVGLLRAARHLAS